MATTTSLLTRPNLTHFRVELAVAIKAKLMDPFGQDLLAINDKVQSQKEASKDDRDCFYFG